MELACCTALAAAVCSLVRVTQGSCLFDKRALLLKHEVTPLTPKCAFSLLPCRYGMLCAM